MYHVLRVILPITCMALLTGAASAQTPAVTIGGISHIQGAYSDQEALFEGGTRHHALRSDTEIHLNIAGESELGFAYGATIELEADVTTDARAEGVNADKTFLWIEPSYGRFELGNNSGAEQTMVVNAASIARATGGIDGDDEFYINSTGMLGVSRFLIHPDLPTADAGGIAEDATKLTFYSPEIQGFQLGISFAPDEGDGGQLAVRSDNSGDYAHVFSGGLAYAHAWEQMSINAALVAEWGESESPATHDLGAWQLGASVEYMGFSVAGSYGDWDDSGTPIGSGLDTDFWTLGGAYAWGEAGVSLTWLESERSGNDYTSAVIGADYTLAPGLVPYAEVSFFEADEAASLTDNEGTVILLGTYLNF